MTNAATAHTDGRRVALALGSNLGNRLANLQTALRALAPAVQIEAVSALYETGAVGTADQQPYFNAVCTGRTALAPLDLLRLAKRIEWQMGRRPGPRWSSRPLDIDILLVEGVTLDTPDLTLPHPRIAERGFVLVPFAEVWPDATLADGTRIDAALTRVEQSDIRQLAGPEWVSATYVGEPGQRPVHPTPA